MSFSSAFSTTISIGFAVAALTISACATRPQPLPAPQPATGPDGGSEVAQADTAAPETNRPQPGETCASFLQRLTPSVACEPIDDGTCTCKVTDAMATVAAGTPPDTAGNPPPTNPPAGNGQAATLEFTNAPTNALVVCSGDVCPVTDPVLVSAGYPQIPLQGEAAIRLEFRAPGYTSQTSDYTIKPGLNRIAISLQPSNKVTSTQTATLRYSGAPQGTTVECMSGPCPDKAAHPVTEEFPAIPMSGDRETVLFRFRAPGFRTAMGRYELRRGANVIPISLDPIKVDQ